MRLEAGPREDEAGNEREDDAAHQTRNPGRPISTPKVDYWRAAQAGISHVFPLARQQEYRANCAAAEILRGAEAHSPTAVVDRRPSGYCVTQAAMDCVAARQEPKQAPASDHPEPGQPCLGDLFVFLGRAKLTPTAPIISPSRGCQMAGSPARSAKSRHQPASSRSLRGPSMALS
jgi:hypothetical protein